jgi:hypothetical protein
MGGWEVCYLGSFNECPPIIYSPILLSSLLIYLQSMITLDEKIAHLEACLSEGGLSYADSFKSDIAMFLGEFDRSNAKLHFLERLNTEEQISEWVNRLTSRIVLKYDEESEQLSEFIYDVVENG